MVALALGGLAVADGVDPADLPAVGLGDTESGLTWSSPLLAEVRRLQRPYVSPFHDACQVEACFRDGASSHALAHGLGRRLELGQGPFAWTLLRGRFNPDLIAPPPPSPSAIKTLLER